MARFTGSGDGQGGTGPLDPVTAPNRLFIDGYGNGGFRIAGEFHRGSHFILPDRAIAWPVSAFEEAGAASFAPLIEAAGEAELLLIGMGARMQPVPAAIRDICRAAGLTVEPMDTGAAARTYNILLAEDRRVAAALIAI